MGNIDKGLGALLANFWYSMPNPSQLGAFGKCLAIETEPTHVPTRIGPAGDLANLGNTNWRKLWNRKTGGQMENLPKMAKNE